MFNRGLSLDQAPPFEAVLRFFLTLPFFGLLAAGVMLVAPAEHLTLWDAPAAVGLVHLTVLGFAAAAMVGALFQMLPVVAGATVPRPLFHSRWIHLFLTTGTLLLAGAFLFERPSLLFVGPLLLVVALGHLSVMMFARLLRVENKTPSVNGMIVALASLGFGLVFAVLATLLFLGVDVGLDVGDLRALHLRFMLFGWIGTLVMAVAFQVIEMFYVTPPYPETFRRYAPFAVLGLLVAEVPALLLSEKAVSVLDAGVALIVMLFALITLKRLSQRKRPVADVTVWLWRTAMGALALSALFGVLSLAYAPLFATAALMFGYFVVSVIVAMSYKIVPFLVWFHLNAKGVLETPLMGDIVPTSATRPHLWLHWGVGVFLLAAPWWPTGWRGAGAFLLVSSLLFGYNLFKAATVWRKLKDKGLL